MKTVWPILFQSAHIPFSTAAESIKNMTKSFHVLFIKGHYPYVMKVLFFSTESEGVNPNINIQNTMYMS